MPRMGWGMGSGASCHYTFWLEVNEALKKYTFKTKGLDCVWLACCFCVFILVLLLSFSDLTRAHCSDRKWQAF